MSRFSNLFSNITSSLRERVVNPISERIGNLFGNRVSTIQGGGDAPPLESESSFISGPLTAFRTGNISRAFRNDIRRGVEGLSSNIRGLLGRQEERQSFSRAARPRSGRVVDDGEIPGTSRESIANDLFNDPLPDLEPGDPINITAQPVPLDASDSWLTTNRFSTLPDSVQVVPTLNKANLIQDVDANGVERFLNAHNFLQENKDDPLSLILHRDETDNEYRDPELERKRQSSFLSRGGHYRFIRVKDPKNYIGYSGSGGFFPYFPKEELPFTLLSLGIPKRTELLASHKNYVNRNCLVECFKDFPDRDKVEKLRTMIHGQSTRAKHVVLNRICEILERNIILKKWMPKQNKGKGEFRDLIYPSKKNLVDNNDGGEGGEEETTITKYKYDISIRICLMEGHFFHLFQTWGKVLAEHT